MKKKLQQIKKEICWVVIAPNGEIQYALIGETLKDCKGIIALFNSYGICKTLKELKTLGFKIHKVEITVTQA